MHLQYFQICRDSFNAFQRIEEKIQDQKNSNDEDYIIEGSGSLPQHQFFDIPG